MAQVNYARRLSKSQLELRARFTGQYTDGPVYSAERLSVGGENSVRGYRENLLLAIWEQQARWSWPSLSF